MMLDGMDSRYCLKRPLCSNRARNSERAIYSVIRGAIPPAMKTPPRAPNIRLMPVIRLPRNQSPASSGGRRKQRERERCEYEPFHDTFNYAARPKPATRATSSCSPVRKHRGSIPEGAGPAGQPSHIFHRRCACPAPPLQWDGGEHRDIAPLIFEAATMKDVKNLPSITPVRLPTIVPVRTPRRVVLLTSTALPALAFDTSVGIPTNWSNTLAS